MLWLKDGFGIFLENYSDKSPFEHLHSLPNTVKRLLGKERIAQGDYLATHALFLGYYNHDTERALNKHVNAIKFIHLVTELVPFQPIDMRMKGKSTIDILLPFGFAEMSQCETERMFTLGLCKMD